MWPFEGSTLTSPIFSSENFRSNTHIINGGNLEVINVALWYKIHLIFVMCAGSVYLTFLKSDILVRKEGRERARGSSWDISLYWNYHPTPLHPRGEIPESPGPQCPCPPENGWVKSEQFTVQDTKHVAKALLPGTAGNPGGSGRKINGTDDSKCQVIIRGQEGNKRFYVWGRALHSQWIAGMQGGSSSPLYVRTGQSWWRVVELRIKTEEDYFSPRAENFTCAVNFLTIWGN